MIKNISCLRCNNEMKFLKTENIQLGKTGLFFRDLSNLVAGSLLVDIYVCPKCRKIEFFFSDGFEFFSSDQLGLSSSDDIESFTTDDFNFLSADETVEDLPQVQCPECGKWHDFDYRKCPFCNHKY